MKQIIPPARVIVTPNQRRRFLELVGDALESGLLAQGELVAEFERAFVAAHCPHQPDICCTATSSGTSALEIALRTVWCDRAPQTGHCGVIGRAAIVPTNTFSATAAAVVHAGGQPVLADVDPLDGVMTAETLDEAVRRAWSAGHTVAAACYVHIGGAISHHILGVRDYCLEHDVALVEDCAHAHLTSLGGTPAGLFGWAGCFSFYPTKVLTSGEGGCVLTRDSRAELFFRLWRDHGKVKDDNGEVVHAMAGHNFRMSELHAALGLAQCEDAAAILDDRRRAALRYAERLPPYVDVSRSLSHATNWYKVMVTGLGDRDGVVRRMRQEHGVCCAGEVFRRPLHRQPAYEMLAGSTSFSGTDEFCDHHLCLPVWPNMRKEEIDRACTAFTQSLEW